MALASCCIRFWKDNGETEYAAYFENYHLKPPFNTWYYGASADTGILPHQQHIESHHKAQKKSCVQHLKAATAIILASTIPRILMFNCQQQLQNKISRFMASPIPGAIIASADSILKDKKNYRPDYIRGSTVVQGYYVNASQYRVEPGNLNAITMTKHRTQR